jgi:hypothetical protein
MKKLLLTVGLVCASWAVYGQGVVAFNTLGGGVNAAATNSVTGARITGNTFFAQLFYAEGNITDPLSPLFTMVTGAPATFGTGGTAGYITSSTGGGNRVLPIGPGSAVTFQIRAWDAILGATYPGNNTAAIINMGGSKLAFVAALGSSTAATLLTGLNPGWIAIPVPEPSVIALGIIGGLGVLLLRRRK